MRVARALLTGVPALRHSQTPRVFLRSVPLATPQIGVFRVPLAAAASRSRPPSWQQQQQQSFWTRWMSSDDKKQQQQQGEEGKDEAMASSSETTDGESAAAEAEAAAAAAGGGPASSAGGGGEDAEEGVSEEAARAAALAAELQDAKDKYVRLLAEMENLRRRQKNELEAAKTFGIQKFAKDVLEIVDTLGLAMEAVPEAERSNADNPHLTSLYQGLGGINSVTLKILERHGIHKVDPIDQPFDPNLHEALFQAPDPDREPGTVMAVTKVGFTLNGRTLRAAGVGVVQKVS